MTIWLSRWYRREANTQAYLWYQGFAGNRAQTTPEPPYYDFNYHHPCCSTQPCHWPHCTPKSVAVGGTTQPSEQLRGCGLDQYTRNYNGRVLVPFPKSF